MVFLKEKKMVVYIGLKNSKTLFISQNLIKKIKVIIHFYFFVLIRDII